MPLNEKELKLLATGVSPSGSTGANNLYFLSTNDTAAAVETDGYFDGVLDDGLAEGDVIISALDLDGTSLLKIYFVTAGGADVAVRGLGVGITALTDNSGGTGADTIAVIGASYSQTEVANAIASLADKVNEIITAIQ